MTASCQHFHNKCFWNCEMTRTYILNKYWIYFARFGTICTIYKMWHHPGGVILLVKLLSYNIKLYLKYLSSVGFFTFFKLWKWYQIAQSVTHWICVITCFNSILWMGTFYWVIIEYNWNIIEYLYDRI